MDVHEEATLDVLGSKSTKAGQSKVSLGRDALPLRLMLRARESLTYCTSSKTTLVGCEILKMRTAAPARVKSRRMR